MLSTCITEKSVELFSSNARFVLLSTYLLSGIGLVIGTLLYLATMGAEPTNNDPEIDALPNFDYFFHVIGFIFVIISTFTIISAILFHKKYRVGWILLFGIYFMGSVITLYMIYRGFQIMREYGLFTIPLHVILLFIFGILSLYHLMHKNTRKLFFPKYH